MAQVVNNGNRQEKDVSSDSSPSLSEAVCRFAGVDVDQVRKIVVSKSSTGLKEGCVDTRVQDDNASEIKLTPKEIHRGIIRIGDCFIKLKRTAVLPEVGKELSLNDINLDDITSVFVIDENGKQKLHIGNKEDNTQEKYPGTFLGRAEFKERLRELGHKGEDTIGETAEETEEEIAEERELREILQKFGFKGVATVRNGKFVFSTDKCDVEYDPATKTATLHDTQKDSGLWKDASFVFDELGNVSAKFKGENGQSLTVSCKAGEHQDEFLKDARAMLEDRNLKNDAGEDISSKQRAALLYKLLVKNDTKEQLTDVTLDSIRNLDLKDLNFIKGYHFDDLRIDNCRFENCSFDVSGRVYSKDSTFVGGLIHGHHGTKEHPTALRFISTGLKSEGLQITGMFKDSMFLIDNKTSASQIIALHMDGELPIFLPADAKFQYKTQTGSISEHDVSQELEGARGAVARERLLKRIVNDAKFMTDESKTALTASIKENLYGLVIALDNRNEDPFYAMLKENCVEFSGGFSGTKFDPTVLFETLGITQDYTGGDPVVDSYMRATGVMSAKKLRDPDPTGTRTFYVFDDKYDEPIWYDATQVGVFKRRDRGWVKATPTEKQSIFEDVEHVGAVCA